jgi:hypothetical protein
MNVVRRDWRNIAEVVFVHLPLFPVYVVGKDGGPSRFLQAQTHEADPRKVLSDGQCHLWHRRCIGQGTAFAQEQGARIVNCATTFTRPVGVWTPIADTGTGTTHTFSVPVGGTTQIFLRLTVSEP